MSSSSDSSSDYDDYDDYELDEEENEKEPSKWEKVKEGWEEFLEDESAFFVSQDDQNKQSENTQIEDSNKFYDPLGILKIPPRKSAGVKKEVLSLESESFSPVVFLSEVHSQTKFSELAVGMSKLKEASSSKALEIKFLVKENFEHFVKCKDTVDQVYDLISKSKILEDMSSSFTKIINKSSDVYHPLLMNKKKADEIRKVLTLLNKYKVIFKLPGKITENIKHNEYEKAVHNYKNAKTLITSSQKKEFQKILHDIENIIEDFRNQLFTSLRDPSTKLDQLKKSIKTLMEIGNGKGEWSSVGDPCWYFLSNRYNAITMLFKQCSEDNTLPNFKIIRKLSILLLSNVPNLFKMGKYYVEGKFEENNLEYQKLKQQQFLQQQQNLQQQTLNTGKTKEVKNVNVTVYYLDESFSSYKIDQDKRVKDLIEMCKKRFIEEDDDEFCLYKLSEKKSKSDQITTIKLVELSHDESPFKLQKKWIEKSSKNHKFLFKRKHDEFTSKSLINPAIDKESSHIVQIDLNNSYKSHKKQNSAATSATNEENFKKLIIKLLEQYSQQVEDLFFNPNEDDFPDNENDDDNYFDNIISNNYEQYQSSDISFHMVENVNEVIKCQEMLQDLGMPESYLVSINGLVETLTLHFIKQICSEMVAEVSFLYLLEDWTVNESSDDALASGNQVDGMSTTRLMGEFINAVKSNLEKLSFLSNKPMLLSPVESALCEAIESFGDCLHHLAFNSESIQLTIEDSLNQMNLDEEQKTGKNESDNNEPLSPISISQQQSPQTPQTPSLSASQQQNSQQSYQLTPSEKLLLTLSNCSTVVSKTAIQLRSFYVSLFHQPVGSYLKKVIEKLGVLERLILERYVQEKNLMISDFITRGVLFSGSIWLVNFTPTKVSPFIHTILTKMVFIHNEIMKTINSVDVAFGVTQRIYEFLLISLRHNFSLVDPLFISNEGKAQFLLDVLFIENILEPYNNEKTQKLSQLIRKDLSFIISINSNNNNNNNRLYSNNTTAQFNVGSITTSLDPILKRNITKTSLLYSCFKN
ncbi:hypothetical protein DICPUDRAFT_50260 [Dictyostelium purpureum]|uniref:Exocyst complex component 2 n=1 Tax=Dictyostelium purpureum TaxID=5786 RepID=F0ZXN2_DICPU|nr:uncharacterized protein DICPUDRAFT_50260 [Dictyostelium purpureum]EGC31294.1 hypothetical protein DICPUDRAFT_50260 [Dictyostelium purpureum]|eukprot:XP_003292171.1 hypothetical protein DICPUDRAFT_50260 [Dictyostelium purpureum]